MMRETVKNGGDILCTYPDSGCWCFVGRISSFQFFKVVLPFVNSDQTLFFLSFFPSLEDTPQLGDLYKWDISRENKKGSFRYLKNFYFHIFGLRTYVLKGQRAAEEIL